MLEGTWGLEKSFARALFQTSAEISSGFINMVSATKSMEAIASVASRSESGAYNEEAFRHLLAIESKRSDQSGRYWQIFLVYWTDEQGRIVQMSSEVARRVIAASVHSFRETDYVGWYRDGHILGAVLTVLAKEAMTQVSASLQPRLEDTLRAKIGVEENSRLQIRVCQPHELNGFESGG
jgi:hypothetical protein